MAAATARRKCEWQWRLSFFVLSAGTPHFLFINRTKEGRRKERGSFALKNYFLTNKSIPHWGHIPSLLPEYASECHITDTIVSCLFIYPHHLSLVQRYCHALAHLSRVSSGHQTTTEANQSSPGTELFRVPGWHDLIKGGSPDGRPE